MARRGDNHFRLNDGRRAVRIARDGGIEPAMIEIVAKDGTTFRIYGENAGASEQGAKAWEEAFTKLQAKKAAGGRKA